MKLSRYLAAVILIEAALFSLMAWFRYADIDEGYYLYASRLVFQGKIPYIDFFYTQMPLLPYIYGAWMNIAGFHWFSARLLSVLCSLLTVLVLFTYARKRTGSEKTACIASLLLVFSGQALSWFTTVKTYSVSSLLVLLAFVLLASHRKKIFAAGLCLGLAVNIRLTLLPLVFVSFLWITLSRPRDTAPKAAGAFIAGLLPATLFSVYLLLRDPSVFVFDNFLFHLYYSIPAQTFSRQLWDMLQLALNFVLRPQYLLLCAASAGSLYIMSRAIRSKRAREYKNDVLALLFLAGLFFASACGRADDQYLVVCVPFLITASLPLLQAVSERKNVLLMPALVSYIALCVFSTGTVGGLLDDSGRTMKWRKAGAVAAKAKEFSAPGEAVLSFWPGYSFLSVRRAVPGLENEFGYFLASDRLPPATSERYRIATDELLAALLEDGGVKIVIWDWPYKKYPERKHRLEDIITQNYRPLWSRDAVVIYGR